jgi:hypothetical protein
MARSWLESHQAGASVIMLVAGALIANTIALAPIHEHGHLHWARDVEKMGASIQDWNHTEIERVTPHTLLAGYENEIIVFLVIYGVLFLISNPDCISIRKWWFHLGFPLGYATWSWLKPLLLPVSDFVMIPEWTIGMRGTLFSEYIIVMAIAWATFIFLRIRRSRLK